MGVMGWGWWSVGRCGGTGMGGTGMCGHVAPRVLWGGAGWVLNQGLL